MRDERILYFSPAEFMILLELAEGPACSLLSGGKAPEDSALTAAFTALFQRELIRREGSGFVLTESGQMFDSIRNAPWAVYISDQTGGTALCYLAEDGLWLVELADVILAAQYRVRRLDRAGLERWLFDSGLLEPPALTAEDVRELEAFLEEQPEYTRPVLCLEKHRNGGPVVETYEVYKYRSRWRIRRGGGDQDVYYTQEALSDMLTDCFGKESYDCCECERSRLGKGVQLLGRGESTGGGPGGGTG